MSDNLDEKLVDEIDEHIAVLQSAREALAQAQLNLELGRKRLENALKKYEARAKIDDRSTKHL